MSGISDNFQRPINYLRLSVTDRCNLRCTYCMPAEGIPLIPHSDLLTYEDISSVARVAAGMGIGKVRISGGEPLVRARLVNLIRMLSQIEGIDDLSLTTNGTLLEEQAMGLKEAGIKRINISLDTLKQNRYQEITGYDKLSDVLSGIKAAHRAQLEPVKINTVVMRGINDDELLDFANMSREEGWHVRFIELMPLVNKDENPEFVPIEEMWRRLASLGKLEPCSSPMGNGPASYYRLPGARGTIGFITPVSEHFCFKCNRLRLTADGRLLPCLLSDKEVDLRPALRKGDPPEEIKRLILEAIYLKPEGHCISQGLVSQRRPMAQMGG
ncbi:GTP 3',8-cyclase MoaA [Chloroflexota bacterium]